MASSGRRFNTPPGFEAGPSQNQQMQYYPQYYYQEPSAVNYNNTAAGYNSSYMQDNSHVPYHCPPSSSAVSGPYYPSSEQGHYSHQNNNYNSQAYPSNWVNYSSDPTHHLNRLPCPALPMAHDTSKFPNNNTGNPAIGNMHCQNMDVDSGNSGYCPQNRYQNTEYDNFKPDKDISQSTCLMSSAYPNQVAPLQNLVSMVEHSQSSQSNCSNSKSLFSPVSASPNEPKPIEYPPTCSIISEKSGCGDDIEASNTRKNSFSSLKVLDKDKEIKDNVQSNRQIIDTNRNFDQTITSYDKNSHPSVENSTMKSISDLSDTKLPKTSEESNSLEIESPDIGINSKTDLIQSCSFGSVESDSPCQLKLIANMCESSTKCNSDEDCRINPVSADDCDPNDTSMEAKPVDSVLDDVIISDKTQSCHQSDSNVQNIVDQSCPDHKSDEKISFPLNELEPNDESEVKSENYKNRMKSVENLTSNRIPVINEYNHTTNGENSLSMEEDSTTASIDDANIDHNIQTIKSDLSSIRIANSDVEMQPITSDCLSECEIKSEILNHDGDDCFLGLRKPEDCENNRAVSQASTVENINHFTITRNNRKRKQPSPIKFKKQNDSSAIDLVSKRIELLKVPPKRYQDGDETVLQVLSKSPTSSKSNDLKKTVPKKSNVIKKPKPSRTVQSKSCSPKKSQNTEPIKRSPRLREKLGKAFNACNGLSDELEVIIKRSDDPKLRPKSRFLSSPLLNCNNGQKESKKVLNLPLSKINLLKPIMVKQKDQIVLKPLANNSSKSQLNLYKLKSVLQRNDVTIIDLQRDSSRKQSKIVEKTICAKPHVTVSLSNEEALKHDKSPVKVCCTPDILNCMLSEKEEQKYTLPFVSLEKIKTDNFITNPTSLVSGPLPPSDVINSSPYPTNLFTQFNKLKVDKKESFAPKGLSNTNAQILSKTKVEDKKKTKSSKQTSLIYNDIFIGPHLHFNSNEKKFKIVNPNYREDSVEDSLFSGSLKTGGYYADSEHARKISKLNFPNAMSGRYDAFTNDISWVCVFCKRRSHVNETGDLFGPYFLNGKVTLSIPFIGDKVTSKVFSGMEKRMAKKSTQDFEPVIKESSTSPKKKSKKARFAKLNENDNDKSPNTITTEEIWFHESCICWAPDIYLIGGKIQGLEESVRNCLEKVCVKCRVPGATASCLHHCCTNVYHVPCAKDAGCSIIEKELQLFCPLHNSEVPG